MKVDQAFVGIDHLFKKNLATGNKGERRIFVELFIQLIGRIEILSKCGVSCRKYPPAEISTVGDKINLAFPSGLQP